MSQNRYLRHSMIDWFDQGAIRRARVLVIGAGAVGNETLKCLGLLGIGRIHVTDFDRIELHNLTRAVLFRETDVGRFKAEAAAEAMKCISPDTTVTFDVGDFWRSLSFKRLAEFDAVFCCVDNFEARIRLNRLCRIVRSDLYNAGIDSRFACAEKYPFGLQPDAACYECGLPQSAYERVKERYSCGWLKRKAYEEKKIPTTIVTSSLAAAMMCSLFLQRNHAASASGAVRVFSDTITGYTSVVSMKPAQECVACSICRVGSGFHTITRRSIVEFCRNLGLGDDGVVWLSDPIVLRVRCRKCGTLKTVNDLAEKYDESLAYCRSCGMVSNEVEVRDSITLGELESRLTGTIPPVKYARFATRDGAIIVETED